jgi:hypothetical protein
VKGIEALRITGFHPDRAEQITYQSGMRFHASASREAQL